MGMIKGQAAYTKFKSGLRLTRGEAMLAHCYECNGFEDSRCDCQGKSCPMYSYRLYPGKREAVEGSFVEATVKVKPSVK